MKYAFVFSLLGAICLFYAATSHVIPLQILLLSCGICWMGVGFAYGFNRPQLFVKQSDGKLNSLSWILFWPYHVLNNLTLQIFRKTTKQPWSQINERVYLGCRLNHRDETSLNQLGVTSVLDLTCEFDEIAGLRRLPYFCIPLLDTTAPTLSQLSQGVAWIERQTTQGKVYVHCALGHGPSATFVAAYLLSLRQFHNVDSILSHISAIRSGVQRSKAQLRVLDAWEKQLPS